MKTETKNLEQERPRRNVALAIYSILTTAFIAGYTMVQLFTMS
ncbi:hypothetical protein [Dokdonia sinensis]|nr:hypothetical protein [Dokdonia sinensis]